jgi:dTDP-4-dehydrorhamnose reductase
MRILVTGASGLLGLNLALEAAKQEKPACGSSLSAHSVFGLVNSHALRTRDFHVLEGDLCTPGVMERVLDVTQPDWVIHCAALANIDACERDPERARQLNSEIPGKLADYVARGGARMLHVSTDAVFDGQRGGYAEQDTPNPLSVYARTKLDGEQAVAAANPAAIIARVNLFGWSLSGQRSLAEWFFYNLSAGKPVNGFTDVLFCPLLANDLAQVFLQMLAVGLSGLYHVVSSDAMSKYAFGVEIARRFGLDEALISPVSVQQGGLVAARSTNLTLRNDKLVRELGIFIPTVSAGLGRFYTLYQQGYPQLLIKMGSAA